MKHKSVLVAWKHTLKSAKPQREDCVIKTYTFADYLFDLEIKAVKDIKTLSNFELAIYKSRNEIEAILINGDMEQVVCSSPL